MQPKRPETRLLAHELSTFTPSLQERLDLVMVDLEDVDESDGTGVNSVHRHALTPTSPAETRVPTLESPSVQSDRRVTVASLGSAQPQRDGPRHPPRR